MSYLTSAKQHYTEPRYPYWIIWVVIVILSLIALGVCGQTISEKTNTHRQNSHILKK